MIDYEQIHAYMLLTNWKWGEEVPSIDKMKEKVAMLRESCEGKTVSSASGGFKVSKHRDDMGELFYTTEFILCSQEDYE